MKRYLSNLVLNFPASGIREMFDLAIKYPDAIKLIVGESGFDTPEFIRNAAKRALDEGYTRYNPNQGIPELREALAVKYSRCSNSYTPVNVMVTVGAMEAIMLCLYAVVNPGNEVLIPDPCYPNYAGQILLAGAVPVAVPVYEENGFSIRAADIEARVSQNTRLLFLNSPSNPLGSVIDMAEMVKIAEVAKKHNLLVLSDEVYDRILFDGIECPSIAELPDMEQRTLVVNSFSKVYAMTGWRIGYVIGDEAIISIMPRIQESLVSCVSTFTQYAALEALSNPYGEEIFKKMLADYAKKRDLLINGFNAIPGISCGKTQGSFYAFPSIKSLGISSREFAIELIKKAGVVVVPGSAFGLLGEGYFRAVFTNTEENLKEAVNRIKKYVEENYENSNNLSIQ